MKMFLTLAITAVSVLPALWPSPASAAETLESKLIQGVFERLEAAHDHCLATQGSEAGCPVRITEAHSSRNAASGYVLNVTSLELDGENHVIQCTRTIQAMPGAPEPRSEYTCRISAH